MVYNCPKCGGELGLDGKCSPCAWKPSPLPLLGDIVAYPVGPWSAWQSKVIAVGELVLAVGTEPIQYSHIGILSRWTEGRADYEAQFPRVREFAIPPARPFDIFQLPGLTAGQRSTILAYCRSHLGEWYNLIGVLTAGLIMPRNQAFCSEFAGQAYAAAGLLIPFEHERALFPDAVADWPKAQKIFSSNGGK